MPYDLSQPEHRIVNQVMSRLEDYLFENGIKVIIGEQGRAIIEDLIYDYNAKLSQMYDTNGKLDIENQRLNTLIDKLTTHVTDK